ncbi:MAG: serine/threonine-protein kinase [Gemmatimonadota bacterium]
MTLTSDQWQLARSAFAELSPLDGPALEARLAALASADAAVHAEVAALIQAAASMGDRFERGAASDSGLGAPASGLAGQTLGPWQVTREIGQGGMGAVYEAHRVDDQFTKRVAIKTLAAGRESEPIVRRFRHERQILARLQHPNIATLLDGGMTPDGQPYFVMEYVEGLPLDQWCSSHAADLRQRIGLFQQVCAAVQYAHGQLVIHRDLKPRNILVTTDGTVKLLDFGIAKLLDPTSTRDDPLTQTGALPMTAAYASPEQRSGQPVATASDIYSLGVILYELLTGARPAQAELGPPSTERPVVLPSRAVSGATSTPDGRRLSRTLAGELDSIVLKSLRTEPERRYQSAEQFGVDLGRYLEGKPVAAQSDAWSYRTGKFLRRHRAAAIAAVLAITTMVVGTVISLGQAREARVERDNALREATRTTRVTAFLQEVFASARPQREGRSVTVVQAIDSAIPRIDSSFSADPDLRAAIKLTLGATLNDMFLYERARPLLEDAYRLRRQLDGDRPSKDQADALYDLANIEAQIGSAARAESLYRQSLGMLGRLPEPDSADIYEGLSNVAEVQLNQGRLAEAAALYDTVARALDRLKPSDLELRGVTRANRGTALAALGRSAEAEPVLREAVALFEQARGRDDARVGSALQPLAGTLIFNQKFTEAESVARRAVAIDEKEFGPTNPSTLSALRMMTSAMVESGRCRQAVPELQKMLALRGGALVESDPTLGVVLLQMGQCQAALGNPSAAEATLRDALAVRTRSLGSTHWAVAQTESVLGTVLAQRGKKDEARQKLQEGYDGLKRELGADHMRTKQAEGRLKEFQLTAR